MKTKSLGLNALCTCGSSKIYKRCCHLTGNKNLKIPLKAISYNTHFNRYESPNNHEYVPFENLGFQYHGANSQKAKIKCRLVHIEGNSIVFPEYIFLENSTWIQPLSFVSPILVQLEETQILCDLNIDIQNGETIKVRFFNDSLITINDDKSHLYDCEIFGPDNLNDYSCGDYLEVNGSQMVKLFHHTDDKGFDGILESMSFWSSKWNYRGNKECVNCNFVYFTHIPEIKFNNDLITIAMSKEGKMDYMIDSFIPPKPLPANFRTKFEEFIYTAEVYKSTSAERNCTIESLIPSDCIDPKHLYSHKQDGRLFFEVCFPYIHRIRTKLRSVLEFDDDFAIRRNDSIINSDYAIVGNAMLKPGLAAVFEEEETKFIFKIEDCGEQSIPDFWFSHTNKDLFTTREINPVQMQSAAINPTK